MKTEIKKDEYIAKIIHDLKTPTTAQIRALESFLISTSNKINQEEKDLIELTLNSCNYMNRLIEIFSCVNKLNYEKIKLSFERFNIVELTQEVLNELSILSKYYELTYCVDFDDEIMIMADKLQIKRVIENLFSNSINYAFRNTEINIQLKKQNDNLIFQIRNNSPYIEPKILNEVFDKYKTHSSYYNKAGVGLGLYLSKEIISAHQGRMIAKSSLDNITIFGFIIPIK
ncbi:MAG: GHKL domain-containing protein [Candidatus Gastranaerophilales bacterium]|nr:GHKL domain-containing protein [Candidatus Gastranaerophilales bacterium]